jgi:hypothetical protein
MGYDVVVAVAEGSGAAGTAREAVKAGPRLSRGQIHRQWLDQPASFSPSVRRSI